MTRQTPKQQRSAVHARNQSARQVQLKPSPSAYGVWVNDLALGILQQQAEASMQHTRSALGDGSSMLVCVNTVPSCFHTYSRHLMLADLSMNMSFV